MTPIYDWSQSVSRTTEYHSRHVFGIGQPFGGPAQVFAYLGRYTHRVGISNQRLLSFDGHDVCFFTKHGKTCTIGAVEFVRRFLLHVLPAHFVKIRHYGLVAAANVASKLETARSCLDAIAADTQPSSCPEAPNSWQGLMCTLTGIDLLICPACGARSMASRPIGATNACQLDTS
jgi:hypothetical protein